MADDALKQKVRDVLKQGYFDDEGDLVDISDGYDDNIHVVVVSRKFQGKRLNEKQDLIWSELVQKLEKEEWERVTLSVGVSPEEIKSL